MAQLVQDASVFRTPTSGVVGEIRRAPKQDTVTELMRMMQAAGMASDLIDKLGNNELAKMAAHGLAESRRKAQIREKGIPTLDTAVTERDALVQEAIQKRMAGIPDVDLQEPASIQGFDEETGQQVAQPQFQGLLQPSRPPSGLPGELNIPLPGQSVALQPQQPQLAPLASPGEQLAGAAPSGQLIPDPSLGLPVVDPLPVKDEHLPAPIQIRNAPQAIQLARIHGDDPMKLQQILESIDRLEGLSPVGLFGLVRGEHHRRIRKQIIQAAEEGRQEDIKLQAARDQLKIQLIRLNQKGVLSRAKMTRILGQAKHEFSKEVLTDQTTKLRDAQTRLTEAKIPFVGKHRGLTIINRIQRRREKFTGREIIDERRRAELNLKTTTKAAAVSTAKVSGATTDFVERVTRKILADAEGKARVTGLLDSAKRLRETIASAGKAMGSRRVASIFSDAGYFELASHKRKKLIFSEASKALKVLTGNASREDTRFRAQTTRMAAEVAKSQSAMVTIGKLDKILQIRRKANRVTAKRATQLAQDLAKYKRDPTNKKLNKLLEDFIGHLGIRKEELTE